MTFLEAALQILRRERRPLHYKEIAERAISRKLLTFVGRTPEVTMQAQLTQAVKKAPGAPFVRVKPGVFGLLRYPETAPEPEETEVKEISKAENGAAKGERKAEGPADARDKDGRGRRRRRGRRGRGGRVEGEGSVAAGAGGEAQDQLDQDDEQDEVAAPETAVTASASEQDREHEAEHDEEPDVGGSLSAEDRAAALAESLGGDDEDEDRDDDQEDEEDDEDEGDEESSGDQQEGEDDDEDGDQEDEDEEGDEDEEDEVSDDATAPQPLAAAPSSDSPARESLAAAASGQASAPAGSDQDDQDDLEGPEDELEAGVGASPGEGFGGEAGGRRRRRRRRRRGRGGGFEAGGEAFGGAPVAAAEGAPSVGEPGAVGEELGAGGAPAAAGEALDAGGAQPSFEAGREGGRDAGRDGGRRVMTPTDAAIEILRGQPPGRGVHVRQIADAAVRRRLIHGEPHEAWRVIRAALAAEPKERLRAGVRPRVRPAGSGLFALARRPPDADLERAEHVFGEARRALRERTLAALEQKLTELPSGGFESLVRVLLQREGFGPATFVKRVEGTVYLETLRGRGFKPSKCMVALRSGGAPAGRRAIGELRAGVRARNQDEGVLILAGRLADEAISEWKQAGPPIEVVDGPALAESCVRHGVGVVNAMVSVDFVDADFFAELTEG